MAISGTTTSRVRVLETFEERRWAEFVSRHPRSTVFHTIQWIEALRRTYGYRPVVITTSPAGPLGNGIIFSCVDSWITGRRWVSLPFSDHCAPLVDNDIELGELLAGLEPTMAEEKLRYMEIRPLCPLDTGVEHWQANPNRYYLHRIDLSPPLDTLFSNCHKDSTQRKIRRAHRENLQYEEGRSGALLDAFYQLLIVTRRRHGVPPQPRIWFQNLVDCFGESLKIRVASKDGRPVAAILTIQHRDTLFYKNGGSDAAWNRLGGMHLLLWRCIEEAKENGLRSFDLGRSDTQNAGLITFKDRWGGSRSELVYSCNVSRHGGNVSSVPLGRWNRRLSEVMRVLPAGVLSSIGSLLYRHIG